MSTGCPVDLVVTYSSHYCSRCRKYFNIDLSDVALPGSHYTRRVPHQLCTFHVLKELTQGVLTAVAKERERLAKSKPKLGRSRPSSQDKEARRLVRKSKSVQQKISDLFRERFLLVKRRLTQAERKRFLHITRGLSPLRKLREIMDHIYALFDRRCRTHTALGKLKKLHQWVSRFTGTGETLKKVFSPHLEKALTFLDDKLLPATSNAVGWGNRHHRRCKRVYTGSVAKSV